MDVVGDDDMVPAESSDFVHPSKAVIPETMVLHTETVPVPSSSLFDQVDEPTLPRSQLLEMVARQEGSSNSTTSASSSLSDESSIPYDTFDTTAPQRHTNAQVVIPQPKLAALPYSSNQSGLVYDVRMRFHAEIVTYDDKMDEIHPEDPRRIHEIFVELANAGLVVDELADASPEDSFKLWRIAAREATLAEVCLVHTPEHYAWVEDLPSKS